MTASPDHTGRPAAAHLAGHLHDLAARLAVPAIDHLWIFPTRRVAGAFSTVIAVAAFAADDRDRRRVLTAHYTVRVDRAGRLSVLANLLEHGLAPADRLDRLIDGVLRRLDEDLLASPPRAAAIGGDPARWDALLAAVAVPPSSPSRPSELAPSDLVGD